MSVPGFTESERRGLLGKVINYLDTSTTPDISIYEDDVDEKRNNLSEYFTKKELKLILGKIRECSERRFVDYINLFSQTTLLTDKNIKKIWDYLREWRVKYFNGENMDDFLCGFLGKIRRHRNNQIQNASQKLYSGVPEPAIIRKVSTYLDQRDNEEFLKALNRKGGKKSVKNKRRKYKRKTKKRIK